MGERSESVEVGVAGGVGVGVGVRLRVMVSVRVSLGTLGALGGNCNYRRGFPTSIRMRSRWSRMPSCSAGPSGLSYRPRRRISRNFWLTQTVVHRSITRR